MNLKDRLKQAIRPAPPGTPTLGQILADQPDDAPPADDTGGRMSITFRDISAEDEAPAQRERSAA